MYPYRYDTYTTVSNSGPIYRSNNSFNEYPINSSYPVGNDDDRFLLAPFVFGGLAGTALGYGLANNNQLNNYNRPPCCTFYPIPQPMPYYPTFNNTNTFYN